MATIESIDQVIKLEDVSGIINNLDEMSDYFSQLNNKVQSSKKEETLVIEGVDLIFISVSKLERKVMAGIDATSSIKAKVIEATKNQRKKELQELLERKSLQKQVLERRLVIETNNLSSAREAYQNSLNEGSPSAHSYQSFVTNCENALTDINAKLETINKEIEEIQNALNSI